MQTILDSADQPAHDAFVEKKSEFIGDACHIDSLDEALAFVQTIRDQHPKARHVAYAAVCGGSDGRLAERMSDDGEPSGTAGKPILDVLRANEMTDCVVAVTRYFGGILLGSGGLIRAYSTGASIAVKAANKAKIVPCCEYQVTLDYPQLLSESACVSGRRAGGCAIYRSHRAVNYRSAGTIAEIQITNYRNVQRDRHAAANGHVQSPGAILKSNDDEWNIEQNIT